MQENCNEPLMAYNSPFLAFFNDHMQVDAQAIGSLTVKFSYETGEGRAQTQMEGTAPTYGSYEIGSQSVEYIRLEVEHCFPSERLKQLAALECDNSIDRYVDAVQQTQINKLFKAIDAKLLYGEAAFANGIARSAYANSSLAGSAFAREYKNILTAKTAPDELLAALKWLAKDNELLLLPEDVYDWAESVFVAGSSSLTLMDMVKKSRPSLRILSHKLFNGRNEDRYMLALGFNLSDRLLELRTGAWPEVSFSGYTDKNRTYAIVSGTVVGGFFFRESGAYSRLLFEKF